MRGQRVEVRRVARVQHMHRLAERQPQPSLEDVQPLLARMHPHQVALRPLRHMHPQRLHRPPGAAHGPVRPAAGLRRLRTARPARSGPARARSRRAGRIPWCRRYGPAPAASAATAAAGWSPAATDAPARARPAGPRSPASARCVAAGHARRGATVDRSSDGSRGARRGFGHIPGIATLARRQKICLGRQVRCGAATSAPSGRPMPLGPAGERPAGRPYKLAARVWGRCRAARRAAVRPVSEAVNSRKTSAPWD